MYTLKNIINFGIKLNRNISNVENKLVVTTGEREKEKGNIGTGN